MKLEKIYFENYKAFGSKQEFEIKPLTLIIGKNSSGKSVVSRLPILLGNTIASNSSALLEYQSNGIDFGGTFIDLIHNRSEVGKLWFQLEFSGDEAIYYSFEIQSFPELPDKFLITKFELIANENSFSFTLLKNNNWLYSKLNGDDDIVYKVKFNGFFPEEIWDDSNGMFILFDRLKELNSEITSSLSNINYIGPFRESPERDYRYPSGRKDDIGTKGENAPHILGMEDVYKSGLLEKISDWYKENFGWALDIDKVGEGHFSIVLVNPDNPKVRINMVDVGHGMSQLLPIIVREYFGDKNENSIDIIEQPELHLHPAAHGNIANLFVDSIKKHNVRYIIETHSEVFILRIRRLIAEGELNIDDVNIYWVDDTEYDGSNLVKIEIDSEGEVSFWPENIFSEDLQEVMAIRRSQSKKN